MYYILDGLPCSAFVALLSADGASATPIILYFGGAELIGKTELATRYRAVAKGSSIAPECNDEKINWSSKKLSRKECPGLFCLEFLAFIGLPVFGHEGLVDERALE